MPFILAATLLALFVANVVTGALTGAPVVGSVPEMLVLLGAAISFTVGILQREAAEGRGKDRH